jgi:hypothetical protein
VILLRVTKLLNLTREFYLVLYELITLIDTCEQQEFHWGKIRQKPFFRQIHLQRYCLHLCFDRLFSEHSIEARHALKDHNTTSKPVRPRIVLLISVYHTKRNSSNCQ